MTTATALDVLKAGQCSPACLLGTETGRCHCRCQGAHHGALLVILVQQAKPKPAGKLTRAARRHQRKGHG
jgi:hypothetical protein